VDQRGERHERLRQGLAQIGGRPVEIARRM
jgi:hypothetical protein